MKKLAEEFIRQFDFYLRCELGLSPSTVWMYTIPLKMIVTRAHCDGQLKQEYESYKTQDDINLLLEVLPTLSERLRIAQLCKDIGLAVDAIKQLFKGESVSVNGTPHSLEHNEGFKVQDAKLQILKENKDSDKLLLKLNGQNIIDWLKQKYQELKQATNYYKRPNIKPEECKSKGFKM